jgi:hypothetical protein
MNNYLRFAASGILMIFVFGAGVAQAKEVAEKEPNDGGPGPTVTNPLYSAQVLNPDAEGVVVKPARIGPLDGSTAEDVDYYKFTYQGDGSPATFTVQMCASVDPRSATAAMALIRLQDGVGKERIGSASTGWPAGKPCKDATITPTTPLINGTEYVIAVTDAPADFKVSGGYDEPYPSTTNFNYTLKATGLKAAVTEVGILVKPHYRHGPLPVNLVKGHGKVKVAVLGSDTFDVATIDTSSLSFGATGDEDSLFGCKKELKDVNKDGNLDLVCRFNVAYTGLTTASKTAVLKGKTKDSEDIQGTGTVKVIASKKHHDDDDDDDDEPRIARHR